jgi:putative ABC transport system permease protein
VEIKTIWLALWRSPAGPLLLAAQVALCMMIIANVTYVISIRLETTSRPTGLDLNNIFWIATKGYAKDYDQQSAVRFDLEYLSLLPGVIGASAINGVPQTLGGLRSSVSEDAEMKGKKRFAVVYQTTANFLDTLGLRLVQGRVFDPDTVLAPSSDAAPRSRAFGEEVVITDALAIQLFGSGKNAVGKPLYFSVLNGSPAMVVGVVELMQAGPRFGPGSDWVNQVVLAPAIPNGPTAIYLVRTKPGLRSEVIQRVRHEFESVQNGRYVNQIETLQETAARGRAADRRGAVVFAILSSLVLSITMLGLFGFSAFTVGSRTKEIGTRRAIGATQADIVRHFLVENWLVTTAGIGVGTLGTLVFALQLSKLLELPRLPIVYLVCSMVLVWSAGLLSALIPSLTGAKVAPAMATRSA